MKKNEKKTARNRIIFAQSIEAPRSEIAGNGTHPLWRQKTPGELLQVQDPAVQDRSLDHCPLRLAKHFCDVRRTLRPLNSRFRRVRTLRWLVRKFLAHNAPLFLRSHGVEGQPACGDSYLFPGPAKGDARYSDTPPGQRDDCSREERW